MEWIGTQVVGWVWRGEGGLKEGRGEDGGGDGCPVGAGRGDIEPERIGRVISGAGMAGMWKITRIFVTGLTKKKGGHYGGGVSGHGGGV